MEIVLELPDHKVERLRQKLEEYQGLCTQSDDSDDWESLIVALSQQKYTESEIFNIVKEPLTRQLNGGSHA